MKLEGVHNSAFVVKCYNCYSTEVVAVGQITIKEVNGRTLSAPHYHCIGCNVVFEYVPECIKTGTEHVIDYVPAVPVSSNPSSGKYTNSSYQTETNKITDELQNVGTDIRNSQSTLNSILSAIQQMNYNMFEIIQKNNELMDKLVKDPLALMRKNISDFDLK